MVILKLLLLMIFIWPRVVQFLMSILLLQKKGLLAELLGLHLPKKGFFNFIPWKIEKKLKFSIC